MPSWGVTQSPLAVPHTGPFFLSANTDTFCAAKGRTIIGPFRCQATVESIEPLLGGKVHYHAKPNTKCGRRLRAVTAAADHIRRVALDQEFSSTAGIAPIGQESGRTSVRPLF
jgi:hypothetical protein